MKVLYLGYYRDGTGWAKAAQDYILALDSAGVEVVPRFIKLNNQNHKIPERIDELESQNDKNCNIVIQHLLPHHMEYNGLFEKNIALYVTETDNCKKTCWPEKINLMDEAWVPNKFMATEARHKNNIIIPHFVVPHACDVTKYQKEYKKIEIPELEQKFVFYYIGEVNKRKNIGIFLKAFHCEFGTDEDVGVFIKGHIPGRSEEQSYNHIAQMCESVKEGLKIYPERELYHQEVILSKYLSEDEIMGIHSSFDCLVSSSFGEAWGIPIFDAMAMGKTPISTNTGGPRDFINGGGRLVKSRQEPCFGMNETFKDLYTGKELWDSPDINDLQKAMRAAFQNKEENKKMRESGIENSYSYSYSNVGMLMKKILNGEHKTSFCSEKNLLKKASIEGLFA